MTDSKQYGRNWLFYSGTVLLTLGTSAIIFSTYTLYFYYLPLWTILLGIIFIWFSDRKIKVKILWTATPFVIYFLFQFAWFQFHKAPPETFLIPQNYRGTVRIHFNKQCGQKIEEENGRRIYRIPMSGVLLSQFQDKQGFIDQQYYLVDSVDNRTTLSQLDVRDYNEEWTTEKNPHEPSRDILGVFHAGQVGSDGTYEFYISTYRQLSDTFGFQYDKRFDSIDEKTIELCGRTRK